MMSINKTYDWSVDTINAFWRNSKLFLTHWRWQKNFWVQWPMIMYLIIKPQFQGLVQLPSSEKAVFLCWTVSMCGGGSWKWDQSEIEPEKDNPINLKRLTISHSGGVAPTCYLPLILWDGCGIFSLRWTDMCHEVWKLDLWWISGD